MNSAALTKETTPLFFVQIFSTIGYSVLASTLILYLKYLHFSDVAATTLMAAFMALNYGSNLVGGYIGGRWLSYRSLFVFAMVLQVIGCLLLAKTDVSVIYLALALFLSGAGLHVTCLNCMVTQLFDADDKRREAAFLWNYSGMNVGFFAGFMLAGFFQLSHNYHALFTFSAITNVISIFIILYAWQYLQDRGSVFSEKMQVATGARKCFILSIGLLFCFGFVFVLWGLLNKTDFSLHMTSALGVIMFAFIVGVAFFEKEHAVHLKLMAFLILTLAAFAFFVFFLVQPMAIMLFLARNVDKHVLGFSLAPQWFLEVNSVVIMLGGPIFAMLFRHWRSQGKNISIPLQFSLGLCFMGVGYLVFAVGTQFADVSGLVSPWFAIVAFFLFALAELSISPIGFSMIGELVPRKLQGIFMGIWMMATGVAAPVANKIAQLMLQHSGGVTPINTDGQYEFVFFLSGGVIIFVSLLLCVFKQRLHRMMEG